MDTKFQLKGRTLVVQLEAEIDHHYVKDLQKEVSEKMQQTMAKHLVFDFQKVEFMDSSGIGLIMGSYKKTNLVGGTLFVCNVKERMKRILRMSGVEKWICCMDNLKNVMKEIEG